MSKSRFYNSCTAMDIWYKNNKLCKCRSCTGNMELNSKVIFFIIFVNLDLVSLINFVIFLLFFLKNNIYHSYSLCFFILGHIYCNNCKLLYNDYIPILAQQ